MLCYRNNGNSFPSSIDKNKTGKKAVKNGFDSLFGYIRYLIKFSVNSDTWCKNKISGMFNEHTMVCSYTTEHAKIK